MGNKAGYEYLLAYKITVPIYDYTVEFCRRCSPYAPARPSSPSFPPLPNNLELAVNLLVDLTIQTGYLQDRLIESLKKKFTKEGGFRENLFKKRAEFRREGKSS